LGAEAAGTCCAVTDTDTAIAAASGIVTFRTVFNM
jgi:hypothetical protein